MYPKAFYADHRLRVSNGTCFVLMPFAPNFKQVYENIAQALEGEEIGFDCKRADDFFGGGHIIEDILRGIWEAEIVIADVTTKNPNVFYELGIAHMTKDVENVIIITQRMDDVPFDLQPFRCILYQQTEQGLPGLKRDLVESVKAVSRPSYRFSVAEGTKYQFPKRLLGKDRYFYDFEISVPFVAADAAKLILEFTRYAAREPIKKYLPSDHALTPGELISMQLIPFSLRLEQVAGKSANFVLVAESRPNQRPE